MLASIFRVIGGILATLIFITFCLATIKGSPSSAIVNKNFLATAYLEKNSDSYAECLNSAGGEGDILIGQVVFDKLRDYPLEKLNEIADQYKEEIDKQCEAPIADYEQNYVMLQQTEAEIAYSSQSLLGKLLKRQVHEDDTKLRNYDPKLTKFRHGNPLTNLTFTRTDVEQYFADRL